MHVHLDSVSLTGNEPPRVIRQTIRLFKSHFTLDYPAVPAANAPQALRADILSRTKVKYDIEFQNEKFATMLDPDSTASAWHDKYTRDHPYPANWEVDRDRVPPMWTVAFPNEAAITAAHPIPTWIAKMLAAFESRFVTPTERKDVVEEMGRLRQTTQPFKQVVDAYDKLHEQLSDSSSRKDGVQRDELLMKMTPELRTQVRIHLATDTCTKQELVSKAIELDNELHRERQYRARTASRTTTTTTSKTSRSEAGKKGAQKAAKTKGTKCSFCHIAGHTADQCWKKNPELRP